MTGSSLTTINSLERTAEEFYSRLNYGEADHVRNVVDSLKAYMARVRPDYLVAGVGGILRFNNPVAAQDIDLAVSGLKYTTSLASRSDHSFQHVIDFTREIGTYFTLLNSALIDKFGKVREEFLRTGGSGPFRRVNTKYLFGEEELNSTESHLEEFGWYNSKGLRVCFENSRPIDIQFVFNETPEEWKANQSTLEDVRSKRRNISQNFPYAIL